MTETSDKILDKMIDRFYPDVRKNILKNEYIIEKLRDYHDSYIESNDLEKFTVQIYDLFSFDNIIDEPYCEYNIQSEITEMITDVYNEDENMVSICPNKIVDEILNLYYPGDKKEIFNVEYIKRTVREFYDKNETFDVFTENIIKLFSLWNPLTMGDGSVIYPSTIIPSIVERVLRENN